MNWTGRRTEDLKTHNAALVMRYLLNHETVSRRDLASFTGLAPSSISNITRLFMEKGILRRVGNMNESRTGRRADLLARNPHAGSVICLALTPGECCIAMLNMDYTVTAKTVLELSDGCDGVNLDDIKKGISRLIQKCRAGSTVAVGVSMPDHPYNRQSIKRELESSFALPVYTMNNVEAMASAEYTNHFQSRYSNLIFTYIGRGIGSAVIRNRELWMGHRNSVNALGHTYITDRDTECRCGGKGCLESVSSETGIARSLIRDGIIDRFYYGDELIDFILTHRKECEPALRDAAGYFARGVMNLACFEDPPAILITGRINRLNPWFSNYVNEVYWRIIRQRADFYPPELIFHTSQDTPELLGAAVYAFTSFFCGKEVFHREKRAS